MSHFVNSLCRQHGDAALHCSEVVLYVAPFGNYITPTQHPASSPSKIEISSTVVYVMLLDFDVQTNIPHRRMFRLRVIDYVVLTVRRSPNFLH